MKVFNALSPVILVAIVAGSLAWSNADEFEITRSTIDGGGIMRSSGGDFELSGTIGQADAGVLTGGSFELTGGFWFAIEPGDCNDDGLVGLHDHAGFLECLAGPGQSVSHDCRCFDVNHDDAVDLADLAANQTAFTPD